MTVLLKEAIMPNLMQSIEGNPVFVHTGPFANIANGASSIISDRIALKLVGENGFVLTEAGFGADIGMEKFFNIKCRASGLRPSASVLVSTVRALKMHGDGDLEKGCANIVRHIENANNFGIPVILCVNKFAADTEEEHNIVIVIAKKAGAFDAVVSDHWAKGGLGAVVLAKAFILACEQPSDFKFTYPLEGTSIKEKIESIATNLYRADGVDYSEEAEKRIEKFEKSGFSHLPICMAKTQYSFSADPKLIGAPTGFRIKVRDVRASVGAGFVFPLLGAMMTMPGLPTRPAFFDVDIDHETGRIKGLF
jgi:methylenetetrahydrofolate dehydrogenase (NADP+)/methenyltetrahydrofolate cyclohydrolase/formyltetrahydrofolate synthetase